MTIDAGPDPGGTSKPFLSIGVDPPQGWAIWGYEGFMGWGQGLITVRRETLAYYDKRQRFDRFDKGSFGDIQLWMRAATELKLRLRELRRRGYRAAIATVENPYGVARDNPKAMLANATATGWWYRELQTLECPVWGPMAVQWRRGLGFQFTERSVGKALSIRTMEEIAEQTGSEPIRGPKGGDFEHANEAMCIALAAWIRYRMDDGRDAASEWFRRRGVAPRFFKRPAAPWLVRGAQPPWLYSDKETDDGQQVTRKHQGARGRPPGQSARGPRDLREVFSVDDEVRPAGQADHREGHGGGRAGGGGDEGPGGESAGLRDPDGEDEGAGGEQAG